MMKTVLITGVAGFVGANLVIELLKTDTKIQIIGIDNMNDYYDVSIKEYRLSQIEKQSNHNWTFIKGNIADKNLIEDIFKRYKPNIVVNLAAQAGVRYSITNPDVYMESNMIGFYNILEACRYHEVGHLVYASSSSVYGDEPNLPKVEERIGKVLSPYALTKKTDEEYGRLYTKLYGLETVGLRYFNVFGRRQDPLGYYAAVIPKFVKQLLKGEQPVINGDGQHSRDFTYIENVIEANLKACLSGSEAAGEAYNIAYGGRVFMTDLYNTIAELLESDVKPIYGPDRPGDIKHSNADISKARRLLKYDPDYSFHDGIKLCVEWYKENL